MPIMLNVIEMVFFVFFNVLVTIKNNILIIMSPLRRETYCFSLIFLPLPLLLLLLSEAGPDHNFFVFPDRSIIFGMWVLDHKAVCHIP
jgi:hypothetical protein